MLSTAFYVIYNCVIGISTAVLSYLGKPRKSLKRSDKSRPSLHVTCKCTWLGSTRSKCLIWSRCVNKWSRPIDLCSKYCYLIQAQQLPSKVPSRSLKFRHAALRAFILFITATLLFSSSSSSITALNRRFMHFELVPWSTAFGDHAENLWVMVTTPILFILSGSAIGLRYSSRPKLFGIRLSFTICPEIPHRLPPPHSIRYLFTSLIEVCYTTSRPSG